MTIEIPEITHIEVQFSYIEDFENLDNRVSALSCIHANTIGVNEGFVEFCPNDKPVNPQEYYGWLWLLKPHSSKEYINDCDDNLKNLIIAYSENKLEHWYKNH